MGMVTKRLTSANDTFESMAQTAAELGAELQRIDADPRLSWEGKDAQRRKLYDDYGAALDEAAELAYRELLASRVNFAKMAEQTESEKTAEKRVAELRGLFSDGSTVYSNALNVLAKTGLLRADRHAWQIAQQVRFMQNTLPRFERGRVVYSPFGSNDLYLDDEGGQDENAVL